MSELSQVKGALEDIKKVDGVLTVSLVSRGGLYVMGEPLKGVHKETYSAMSAIILGAAETTANDMKDRLDKVVVELSDQNLILIGAGPKYLMAVTANKSADAGQVALRATEAVSELDT
ncbi:roadblock/LC7 domain-containing protein [Methanomassiliicoccus luminyensis]|uniref:roadblock/LC7 domain-containing protein n=1 Tax=Methanomassiliicoccus luminyensis TaxID=1080712 RepID=UPI000360600D|nr:roadblock/LC7 domain-containing protein [Methanomassiliicoccus luminyensis]